jgi:hypothetical protein
VQEKPGKTPKDEYGQLLLINVRVALNKAIGGATLTK